MSSRNCNCNNFTFHTACSYHLSSCVQVIHYAIIALSPSSQSDFLLVDLFTMKLYTRFYTWRILYQKSLVFKSWYLGCRNASWSRRQADLKSHRCRTNWQKSFKEIRESPPPDAQTTITIILKFHLWYASRINHIIFIQCFKSEHVRVNLSIRILR